MDYSSPGHFCLLLFPSPLYKLIYWGTSQLMVHLAATMLVDKCNSELYRMVSTWISSPVLEVGYQYYLSSFSSFMGPQSWVHIHWSTVKVAAVPMDSSAELFEAKLWHSFSLLKFFWCNKMFLLHFCIKYTRWGANMVNAENTIHY